MDKAFEKQICTNFFGDTVSERMWYELCNPKKRDRFFRKIAHTSENYLSQKCIVEKHKRLVDKSEIVKFLGDTECYVICMDTAFDGNYNDIHAILDVVLSYGPLIIVNRMCTKAYLETEYNFSEHVVYFLSV